ncbi:MAG: type II toxin-antitoxin system HicB family antitoxin [Brevundimonas sp.]|uniref:type II toxin-antitoxin system HicB family antitoxin n=1 Tax=Brevundimonas sp. TaxID=1871086 RepID=UPI0030018557
MALTTPMLSPRGSDGHGTTSFISDQTGNHPMHYVALLDVADDTWGVTFPDLDGCTAMGGSAEEALANAQEALRDWTEARVAHGFGVPEQRPLVDLLKSDEVREELAEGASLARVLLVEGVGRPVKANLSLDSGVLHAIDNTAKRLGITRSAMVEKLAKDRLPEYA